MKEIPPDRDDGRFEEVLGRLDALVRRGQPAIGPAPPPLVEEARIPVLTEVYRPGLESRGVEVPAPGETKSLKPAAPIEERLEQALTAALPELLGVVEDALVLRLRPTMEDALTQALADLRPQTEALLRSRLRQALAEDQSEP